MLTKPVASSWSSACSTSRMVPVRPMPALRGGRGGPRSEWHEEGMGPVQNLHQTDEVCRVRDKREANENKKTENTDVSFSPVQEQLTSIRACTVYVWEPKSLPGPHLQCTRSGSPPMLSARTLATICARL